ncbi:hypothetical protein D3C76_1236030 [compost metagenome]
MNIYIYSSIGILALFFIIEFVKSRKEHDCCNSERKLKASDMIYLVPLLLILFINDGNLSASTIKNKGFAASAVSNTPQVAKATNNLDIQSAEEYIEITDVNYLDVMGNITNDLDSYVGKKIKIKGFVFKKEDMDKNNFVISRLYMSCCTADTQIVGYLCEYDQTENSVKIDDWLEIDATIDKGNYGGELFPLLKITSLEKIDKLAEEYVY